MIHDKLTPSGPMVLKALQIMLPFTTLGTRIIRRKQGSMIR